jgi:hypothetical protein
MAEHVAQPYNFGRLHYFFRKVWWKKDHTPISPQYNIARRNSDLSDMSGLLTPTNVVFSSPSTFTFHSGVKKVILLLKSVVLSASNNTMRLPVQRVIFHAAHKY